jgi:hypothetical protein
VATGPLHKKVDGRRSGDETARSANRRSPLRAAKKIAPRLKFVAGRADNPACDDAAIQEDFAGSRRL